MKKLIYFELRKIFSKRLSMVTLIGILLFSALLSFSTYQNKYAFDQNAGEGSGKAAVEIDKEIAAKYEGILTDEKVRQMMSDFAPTSDLHSQIEQMLAGQPCSLADEVRSIVNKQGRLYTERLFSAVMEAGFDLHAMPLVMLGGGACIVNRHVSPKDGLCRVIPLLDDRVNAIGFERTLGRVQGAVSEG